MKRSQASPQETSAYIVAILSFYSAWSFWESLLYVEGGFYDLLIPSLYGLVAIVGSIALLFAARSTRHSGRVRLFLLFSGAALLGMPFVFYYLKSPLFITIVDVLYWLISLTILGGLFFTASSQAFNRNQRIGILASAIAAFLAPFMPWMQRVLSMEMILEIGYTIANWSYWYWTYGSWIAIIIWGWTGILMSGKIDRTYAQAMNQLLFVRSLIVGLCFFFVGVLNPVSLSSETYLVKTYVGGQLVNSDISTLPTSMNLPLVVGAFLIGLSVTMRGLLRPTTK